MISVDLHNRAQFWHANSHQAGSLPIPAGSNQTLRSEADVIEVTAIPF